MVIRVPGMPQITALALDRDDRHFVRVPRISEPSLSFAKLLGVVWAGLQTPLSNRLIGDDDTALGQQVFDVTKI